MVKSVISGLQFEGDIPYRGSIIVGVEGQHQQSGNRERKRAEAGLNPGPSQDLLLQQVSPC